MCDGRVEGCCQRCPGRFLVIDHVMGCHSTSARVRLNVPAVPSANRLLLVGLSVASGCMIGDVLQEGVRPGSSPVGAVSHRRRGAWRRGVSWWWAVRSGMAA
jgi:hypothetical protein